MSPEFLEALRRFCATLNIGYPELVSAALAAYIVMLTRHYQRLLDDYRQDREAIERMADAVDDCTKTLERLVDEVRWKVGGGQ